MTAEYASKKTVVPRPNIIEPKLDKEIIDTVYDNIQLPALIYGFQGPAQNTKDAYALEMLHSILAGGTSSRVNKSVVESKELALQAVSFTVGLEDAGVSLFLTIANKDVELNDIKEAIDEEIIKIQNELVSEKEFQKVKNQIENDFYSSNSRSEEHTSELQSRPHLVCRLLLEKKKKKNQ